MALLLLLALVGVGGDPVVQLDVYQAKGFTYKYRQLGQRQVSNVFLGLPFAQPPVGNLRFELPQNLTANASRQVGSSELPPGCIQQEPLSNLGADLPALYPVSEDCLYVNVLAPAKPAPPNKPYPVLVWIHGGGFVYGMSRFYGWQQLARHFNSRGIVVVLIQYRLAFFGYLTLNQGSGNLGLWDQTAALRWVHHHIGHFGGDPNQVTIWGNSAGSVSVHALSLSPHSNKLFRYAYQSSGSLYNLWANAQAFRNISIETSLALGCSGTDYNAAKACLKTKTVEQFYNAVIPFARMNNAMYTVHWGPAVDDDDFFGGQSIAQLTQESPINKIMYGSEYGEGVEATLKTDAPVTSVFAYWLGLPLEEESAYTKANFSAYITNYLNNEETGGSNRSKIQKLLEKYYYRDEAQASSDPKFWFKRYSDTQSDGTFKAGLLKEIREKHEMGKTQYVYLFQYVRPSHLPLTGLPEEYSPHAYELQYTSDCVPYFAFNKSDTNAVEKYFTKKLVDGIAQFVKTGNPATPGQAWPAVSNPSKVKYLQVGSQVTVANTHFAPIDKVWKKVYDLGYGSQVFLLD